MIENEHFELLVRIQTDRGQRVVTSGPYRVVRHPGYAGFIVGAVAMPLVLGTWWTCVPVGALMLLFVIRTALEDRTLRQELEGYEAKFGLQERSLDLVSSRRATLPALSRCLVTVKGVADPI